MVGRAGREETGSRTPGDCGGDEAMVVAHVEGTGRRWKRQEDGTRDMKRGSVMWRGHEGAMEMFKVKRTWWWDMRRGQGDGRDHMEMVEGTEKVRERGQGRSWR